MVHPFFIALTRRSRLNSNFSDSPAVDSKETFSGPHLPVGDTTFHRRSKTGTPGSNVSCTREALYELAKLGCEYREGFCLPEPDCCVSDSDNQLKRSKSPGSCNTEDDSEYPEFIFM